MNSNNNGKLTRRKFVKGAAGAAVCCACFPLDDSAASAGKLEQKGKEQLAGACGIYCGSCPAYIARHGDEAQRQKRRQKRTSSGPAKAQKGIPDPSWMDGLLCDGCLSGGNLAPHCRSCAIRLCAADKQKNSRCSDCGELPCHRVTMLINMGNYLHRKEYLPNLKKIREMGVQEWAEKEDARWRCPKCGQPVSWYDAECVVCGAPRSEQIFPLSS